MRRHLQAALAALAAVLAAIAGANPAAAMDNWGTPVAVQASSAVDASSLVVRCAASESTPCRFELAAWRYYDSAKAQYRIAVRPGTVAGAQQSLGTTYPVSDGNNWVSEPSMFYGQTGTGAFVVWTERTGTAGAYTYTVKGRIGVVSTNVIPSIIWGSVLTISTSSSQVASSSPDVTLRPQVTAYQNVVASSGNTQIALIAWKTPTGLVVRPAAVGTGGDATLLDERAITASNLVNFALQLNPEATSSVPAAIVWAGADSISGQAVNFTYSGGTWTPTWSSTTSLTTPAATVTSFVASFNGAVTRVTFGWVERSSASPAVSTLKVLTRGVSANVASPTPSFSGSLTAVTVTSVTSDVNPSLEVSSIVTSRSASGNANGAVGWRVVGSTNPTYTCGGQTCNRYDAQLIAVRYVSSSDTLTAPGSVRTLNASSGVSGLDSVVSADGPVLAIAANPATSALGVAAWRQSYDKANGKFELAATSGTFATAGVTVATGTRWVSNPVRQSASMKPVKNIDGGLSFNALRAVLGWVSDDDSATSPATTSVKTSTAPLFVPKAPSIAMSGDSLVVTPASDLDPGMTTFGTTGYQVQYNTQTRINSNKAWGMWVSTTPTANAPLDLLGNADAGLCEQLLDGAVNAQSAAYTTISPACYRPDPVGTPDNVTPYVYRVLALSNSGPSQYSNSVTHTLSDVPPTS